VRGLRENIDRLAGRVDKLAESIADLRDVVARHDEAIGELTKNVAELTEDVKELRRGLELEVHMRRSEVGGLRGEVVELRVMRGLADWFEEHAPEYKVRSWPMRRGARPHRGG